MATAYKTPGVYIEEIPKLPPSVAQVETAIPAFVGYTERSGLPGNPLPVTVVDISGTDTPITNAFRISSLLEYETYFGKGPNEAITVDVEEDYDASGVLTRRQISAAIGTPNIHTMYYHMQMYFANGGGPCYIVSVGDTTETAISDENLIAGLNNVRNYDEPTLLVVPQLNFVSLATDAGSIYTTAIQQAADLKDRFAIFDCFNNSPSDLRGQVGINNLKYAAAYHPFLKTSLPVLYSAASLTINYDRTDDGTPAPTANPIFTSLSTELQNLIKLEVDKLSPILPPSSSVAGVYAAVDNSRGVWKAPANVSLARVSGPTININELDQASLNVDVTAGKSINVIRSFTGRGTLVWGARTLAGNDNEWRYVPVRRFYNMVEESVKKSTGVFVFEPNDANTWVKVQGMIENYLTTLWRDGALQGAKPEHAFYVAVGLNKTMTALDILEGRMIVEIGMAVVRPAEFIILRFSHLMAQS
ncbi:MAG: phage tail sheath family protein [Niabella sp.]